MKQVKLRAVGLALLTLLAFLGMRAAWAVTQMMPDRDLLSGTQVVVWGNTMLPIGTPYTLDFGDGSPVVGPNPVADQSYIAHTHTYSSGALPSQNFTATLTVDPGGANEVATATIQVINPAFLNAEQTLDVEINMAIEDGLRSQYVNQTNRAANFAGGTFASWSGGAGNVVMAYTSLAVLAFENHGYNPASGHIYSELVQRGLNFIFDNLTTLTISDDEVFPADPCAEIYSGANYGDPLAPGPDCTGLRATASFDHGYSTAVTSLAIAGSGAPAALANHGTASGGFTVGRTHLEIMQRLVNAMAFGQRSGGWRYTFNTQNDGSTNGWNVLAMLDGAAFGATIPPFVISQLDIGTEALTLVDGSMGYTSKSAQNTAKTGIRLQALHLIGVALGSNTSAGGPTPQMSVDYIDAGWKGRPESFQCFSVTPNPLAPFQTTSDLNNFGCLYAMFNVFKGLKLYNVNTLANSSRADMDWHREYQDYLTQTQNAPTTTGGGDWGNLSFSCCSSDTNGETALALLVLAESATILPDVLTFNLALQEVVFGDTAFLTVKAETTAGSPVPGVTVDFIKQPGSLTEDPFPLPDSLSAVTDAAGEATVSYSYDGSIGPGTDEWIAEVAGVSSGSAFVDWKPNTVVIDGCDTGVPNETLPDGDTLQDKIDQCAVNPKNHGKFVSCVAKAMNAAKKAGIITGEQKGDIMDCAGSSSIGKK